MVSQSFVILLIRSPVLLLSRVVSGRLSTLRASWARSLRATFSEMENMNLFSMYVNM